MENPEFYVALLILSVLLILKYFSHNNPRSPPSPFSIPIIGHLHLIKSSLHQALAALSSQYGPILFLKFGFRPVVVVSSPSAVEECFTKNDIVLANRPQFMAADRLTYNYTALVWAPYGHVWRNLRRLTVVELFSSNSLQKSSIIREEETRSLLRQLFRLSNNGGQKVNMNFWFSVMTFNIILRLATGKEWINEENALTEVGKQQLKELKGIFFTSASMTVCDFIPILRWFGYKGLEKSMIMLHKKRDDFLQGLIDEIRCKKASSSGEKKKKITLIETLLSLQESEPDLYSDDVIKGIILVIK